MKNLTTETLRTSPTSISLYGERDVTRNTLLKELTDLQNLGDFLLARFENPEYRFESLSINLRDVSSPQRIELLNLELGEIVKVEFTPRGILPAIERFGKVIRLSHSFAQNEEVLEVGLESITGTLLVLDDAEFGKLDSGLLAW